MKLQKANYLGKVGGHRAWAKVRGRTAVGYIGCHGMANLGDDAMWQAARSLLGRACLLTDYCPPSYEHRLEQFGLGAKQTLRGVVLGGGTLINPSWQTQVQRAHQQGRPVVTLGTGIGASGFEAGDDDTDGGWAPLLRSMPMLGLRGPLSLEKAKAIGADQAVVTGDLALALTPQAMPSVDRPKRLLVNLSLPLDDQEVGLTQAAKSIAYAAAQLQRTGWELCWVAMTPRDVCDIQSLQEEVGVESKIHQPTDAQQFFELARYCRATLAVRLHAAVLSACVGTAPVLIRYREKCLDFMSSVGLDAQCPAAESIDKDALIHLIESMQHIEVGTAAYRQCAVMRSKLEGYSEEVIGLWS